MQEPITLRVIEVGPKFVKFTGSDGAPVCWDYHDPLTEEPRPETQGMVKGRIVQAHNYSLRKGKEGVRFLNGGEVVFIALPPQSEANVPLCLRGAIMPFCDECKLQEACNEIAAKEDYLSWEVMK